MKTGFNPLGMIHGAIRLHLMVPERVDLLPSVTLWHAPQHAASGPPTCQSKKNPKKTSSPPSVMCMLLMLFRLCRGRGEGGRAGDVKPYGSSAAAGQIADKWCILCQSWVSRAQRRNTTAVWRLLKGEHRGWNTQRETSAVLRRHQATREECKCGRLCQCVFACPLWLWFHLLSLPTFWHPNSDEWACPSQMRLCWWIWAQKRDLLSFSLRAVHSLKSFTDKCNNYLFSLRKLIGQSFSCHSEKKGSRLPTPKVASVASTEQLLQLTHCLTSVSHALVSEWVNVSH